MKHSIGYLLLAVLYLPVTGCKKFVSVDAPLNQASAGVVYSSDATAIAALNGLYNTISQANSSVNGAAGISAYGAVSADELNAASVASALVLQVYKNELTSLSVPFWTSWYKYIYTTNAVIEGLTASTGVSVSVKQLLIGEARFMRAFLYFYLVNFFGEVPLNLTTDYRITSAARRLPVEEVYKQVVTDLLEAQRVLPVSYVTTDLVTATTERVRPNKWVATALLARVYLYMREYQNAETEASKLITNTAQFGLQKDLAKVFLKNNTEAIWQLQPVSTVGANSADGALFVLTGAPNSTRPYYINSVLSKAFEAGDARKSQWVGSVKAGVDTFLFPYKYKVGVTTTSTAVTEYETVFRLAEQYLIRAEARAQLDNVTGARADIDSIRLRAGLSITAANDKATLLKAVQQERQVELFTEFGHRWLDLKRLSLVDTVMATVTPVKGGIWNTNKQWFPLLLTDIQYNPSLVQNTGY